MTRASGPRRVPKQSRSRHLVDRILVAAGELLAERGYENTNTNLVAERAGVSVGSLYQFFADKEEILVALQDKWTARLGAALDERLRTDTDLDLAETIDHVLDIHAALNREPPGLLGFLLTTPVVTPSEGVTSAIRQRLEEMIEVLAPEVPPGRRAVAAAMIVHISNGLYTVGRTAGATDPDVREEVKQALLAYVTPLLGRNR
ncbi:TetR/AcrR family transcriptional regulator [Amycolatopsis nigrescens]|uniref:TetR/AcrR family transcriptional regulator n=1 Tax=Amycolatopsis nigrescens TaxID=381445 RepID=UPI000382D435|nr:TetR/AcrR family transcriptional regulator [Amycolatopsis nigrescens]